MAAYFDHKKVGVLRKNSSGDTVVQCNIGEGKPDFNHSTWENIRERIKSGNSGYSIGDTKSVTLKNGSTYEIRLIDLQNGRYKLADGSNSNAVFEFVQLVNLGNLKYFGMNTTRTNGGGWRDCYVRNTVIKSIEAILPDDMISCISSVNVLSGKGGGSSSGVYSSQDKLFLPAEVELFATVGQSIGIEEDQKGRFDYYEEHEGGTDKIKYYLEGSSYYYWMRSPASGSLSRFCAVGSAGSSTDYNADTERSVSPIFAM